MTLRMPSTNSTATTGRAVCSRSARIATLVALVALVAVVALAAASVAASRAATVEGSRLVVDMEEGSAVAAVDLVVAMVVVAASRAVDMAEDKAAAIKVAVTAAATKAPQLLLLLTTPRQIPLSTSLLLGPREHDHLRAQPSMEHQQRRLG